MNSTFAWLLRREVWETRAVWVAPLICAGIMVLLSIAVALKVPSLHFMVDANDTDLNSLRQMPTADVTRWASMLMFGLSVPFLIVASITQLFYAVDALYSDRRDRSVLFWKSLPLSDIETVLSKFAVGTVLIPAAALAVSIVAQLVVYSISAIKAGGSGLPQVGAVWYPSAWGPGLGLSMWAAFANMLWTAPLVAWLLFVSAVVPRSPLMWATLVPLAVALAEKFAFGTAWILHVIGERNPLNLIATSMHGARNEGGSLELTDQAPGQDMLTGAPLDFFLNPKVWIGLLVAAAFVAATVWARRYRDEST